MAAKMAADEEAEMDYDVYEDSAPEISSTEMIAGFSELASKAQIGSFDEYKLASRLSVPDGNTALVNLIQHKLVARDTRLFDKPSLYGFDNYYRGWRQTKSYQTIELKNEAGVALDAGPITIYRDQAVIGEGYLSRTEKDATAYITFANEGRISVAVTDISENIQKTVNFAFDSKIPNETTALLQIPNFETWEAVDFPENVVKSEEAYVVSVNVPGNSTQSLPLTMRNKIKRVSPLNNGSLYPLDCRSAVKNALKAGDIKGEQRDKFQKYVDDSGARGTIQDKIRELKSRSSEIEKDQKTLTETISGLKDIKTSNADSLKNQLLSRQKSNEKELANIATELYTLQVQQSELNLSLQALVKELDYTREVK